MRRLSLPCKVKGVVIQTGGYHKKAFFEMGLIFFILVGLSGVHALCVYLQGSPFTC